MQRSPKLTVKKASPYENEITKFTLRDLHDMSRTNAGTIRRLSGDFVTVSSVPSSVVEQWFSKFSTVVLHSFSVDFSRSTVCLSFPVLPLVLPLRTYLGGTQSAPLFEGPLLFYKATLRQFQPPTCKLTPPKCKLGRGDCLCNSMQKCRLEFANLFSEGANVHFGGCQFTFWRLKLSWGCFIEKAGAPKEGYFGFPQWYLVSLSIWPACSQDCLRGLQRHVSACALASTATTMIQQRVACRIQ